MHDRPAGRLEARITGYALTLAVGMWAPFLVFVFTSATLPALRDVLAGDFRFFYAIAHFAHAHDFAKIYDPVALAAFGESFVSSATGPAVSYPTAYPPILPMAIAPLGAVSYTAARVMWSAVTAALYAFSCWITWRSCPRLASSGPAVVACALAYPAFMILIAFGQSSAPALALFALAYAALVRDRRWLAGVAIGGLVYKPQLAMGFGIVMLLAGEWKIIGGAIGAAVMGLAIGWWRVGTDVMRTYVGFVLDAPTLLSDLEPYPHHLHSLKGFFALLLPSPSVALAASVVASLLVVVLAWRVWKSPSPLAVRFAAALLATVLIDPHLNVYDLVVLAPAFIVVADDLVRPERSQVRARVTPALIAAFVLPLTGLAAQWTHVQLSVVAMVWLLVAIAGAASRPRPMTSPAR